jgi:hypothetical protein
MKKLKFFLIGFIPGLLIVFFILGKKGANCSGYMPNSRVIAETLSKKFSYSNVFITEMSETGITEKYLKDSIILSGQIDFEKSHAQKKPCPDYVLFYPKKNPVYEIIFVKCKDTANFISLRKF